MLQGTTYWLSKSIPFFLKFVHRFVFDNLENHHHQQLFQNKSFLENDGQTIMQSCRPTPCMKIDNYYHSYSTIYNLFSLNFVENNFFFPKIKQFLKLYFIYLSQKIYHLLFGFLQLILFIFYSVRIFLNYVIVHYVFSFLFFFFSVQLNSLSFKYIIQISDFLKRDYYIYNFSYPSSNFELGYMKLVLHISQTSLKIFKIICRKKQTLCLKLNTSVSLRKKKFECFTYRNERKQFV